MTVRAILPQRRRCFTYHFHHAGHRYYATVGLYKDWSPGEIFLDAGSVGSDIQHISRAGAVAVSLALQYGCPLDVLIAALPTLDDGSAADPFGAFLRLVAADKFA